MREQFRRLGTVFCSRIPLFLAGAGVLLLLGAFLLFLARPPTSVGDVEAIESSLEPSPMPLAAPTTAAPLDLTTDPNPETNLIAPNANSQLGALADQASSTPVRLVIDGIAVDAPVEPYGINNRTGQMAVPRNVSDVAWYEYGPSPGEPGSAVLAAHVDLAGQGPGVFYRLRDLEPGEQVTVVYEDVSTQLFLVRARVTYDKDELPLETVFSRDGEPVLTLITCGGGFSQSAQSYDSNVVVYAVPIDSAKQSGLVPGNE